MRFSYRLDTLARMSGPLNIRSTLLRAAALADLAGLDGVACTLPGSYDKHELTLLRAAVESYLSLFVPVEDGALGLAMELNPDLIFLLPPGLDYPRGFAEEEVSQQQIKPLVKSIHAANAGAGLLVEPSVSAMKEARQCELDYVVLDCHGYSEAESEGSAFEALEQIESAALAARKLGLRVMASGGLSARTLPPIVALGSIEEVVLGHELTLRSVFKGLTGAVEEVRLTAQGMGGRR